MTDSSKYNTPTGDGSSEDQPRLDPETIQDLEVSEELASGIKAGQRDPHPTRTCDESVCWCYTSI